MSDIAITIQKITSVEEHPNADRLEVIKVLGATCCVPKGEYKKGDQVVYFPPDMMLPPLISEELGVANYLKHAMFKDKRIACRIAACRLRGVPSFGFVTKVPECGYITIAPDDMKPGCELTEQYGAIQYVAPAINLGDSGDAGGPRCNPWALQEDPYFHRYTSIQQYWRYPDVFEPDEHVSITEKIHGTNSRVGVIMEDGEWVFAVGSHKVRWSKCHQASRYWQPLERAGVLSLLSDLCKEKHNVIIFGEIYGNSVQDMDYGVNGAEGFAVFDISIDSVYLDWMDVRVACLGHDVPLVPTIFEGPYHLVADKLDEYASGLTTIGTPKKGFKGREGIVIKPCRERYTERIGGSRDPRRAIIKYISADYLDRKGAQDNG